MKIDRVTYRKLVSGPGYSHEALEASATVEPGDTPESALAGLAAWVESQIGGGLGRGEARRDLAYELHRIADKIDPENGIPF